MKWKWLLLLTLVVGWAAAGVGAASGDEPAAAFLEGLRERGYFDTALEYLAAAERNPAVKQSFREILLYERGTTLVEAARQERDAAAGEQKLDEAQRTLQQFVTARPGHLFSYAARIQVASVSVERAHQKVAKAKKLSGTEQQTQFKQARDLYEQAGKSLAAVSGELTTKLKGFPAFLDAKQEPKRHAEKERFRQDDLQARLLLAMSREELAETMQRNSREWTQSLTAAADAYKATYEGNPKRAAGVQARILQGRCWQKLGKHKDATALFNDLLANEEDEFRWIRLKVMPLAVESWTAQQLFLEVWERGAKLIDDARPSETRTGDMQALRLNVAKACKAQADLLKSKNLRDPQIRKLQADGRKYVTDLSRFPNEHQEEARRLLAEFGLSESEIAARPEPKTFADAKSAALAAVETLQAASARVRDLTGRQAGARSAEREDLKRQLAEAERQAARPRADAMQFCRLALKLAGDDTEIADLNLLRYYLCHLLHVEKSYYDAIVIGDFVARHYPDSQNAKQCARIALASLVELNSAGSNEDEDFEEEQIEALADYMVKKWPGQPEADEALGKLIPLLVKGNKLRQAQEYVAKIPAQSAQRGMAELTIGHALWNNYLNAINQVRDWESGSQPLPAGTDLVAKKQELEKLKTQARQTLVDGVERMRKSGDVNKVLAAAVLSLAQIYVDTDAAGRAISLIEDPKIGVLMLVNKNDPAARDDAVAEETYKTALRAYISSLATAGTSARATIDKARGVMASLKRRIATTPEGQQRLVSIYVSLARDLSRQMEIADPGVKKTLGEGFETFLKEVAADASDLSILIWVGDTYLGMGEAFGGSAKSLTPQAKGYFVKAGETYQKILDQGKSDANFLPALAATGIRVKLAKTKKCLGEYSASRDLFEAVLKENPTFLPAQMEAARMYQEWGAAGSEERDNFVRAMIGALPDKAKNGKNTIWGWGEIARVTANNAQFREQFYDARYNLALCRYSYAISQDDAKKKADQLKLAKNDIGLTAGLYPELGGEEKKKQYDNLLKTIQQALGEPAEGLKALNAPQTKKRGKVATDGG